MKNHKRGLPMNYVKNTSTTVKLQMCFFIVYLLKIITSITKANTIIVSTTKPNKSRYIISNKIASIIAPPPHSQLSCGLKVANHICLSSFPMLESIAYEYLKINSKKQKFVIEYKTV